MNYCHMLSIIYNYWQMPCLGKPNAMKGKLQHMSRLVGKPTMWFPNRSDTNRAVQAHKMAGDWKFCI